MNKTVTSREAILSASQKLVMEKGLKAVNMRTVASSCGVAVGSVYNYFPSKADLLTATVENVWKEIFHMPKDSVQFLNFADSVAWVYERIQKGSKQYPGFFTLHSMSFAAREKETGRLMMEHYFDHMKAELCRVLEMDQRVNQEAFNDKLTPQSFVGIVFTNITSSLLEEKRDCSALIETIKRVIY